MARISYDTLFFGCAKCNKHIDKVSRNFDTHQYFLECHNEIEVVDESTIQEMPFVEKYWAFVPSLTVIPNDIPFKVTINETTTFI